MIIALDISDKVVIAKFQCRGSVYSMTISKDRRYLLVAANDKLDDEAASNFYYKISLKKIH